MRRYARPDVASIRPRRSTAVSVRAACRPGIAATTLASNERADRDERDRERGNRRIGHDVERRRETIPEHTPDHDAERNSNHDAESDGDAGLPGDCRCELPSRETERLEQREIAPPPPHRREQGQAERDDCSGCERRAEQRGGVAHRAVVDDLGGTLHRNDGKRTVAENVRPVGDRLQRPTRGRRVHAGAEPNEDGLGAAGEVAESPVGRWNECRGDHGAGRRSPGAGCSRRRLRAT